MITLDSCIHRDFLSFLFLACITKSLQFFCKHFEGADVAKLYSEDGKKRAPENGVWAADCSEETKAELISMTT